jgi:hypothetical protein
MKTFDLIKKIMIRQRLQAIFDRANERQIAEGRAWYPTAYLHALQFSLDHAVPLFKTAGIIAALSPNNKWERNLYDADLFLSKPSLDTKVCTFMANRRKALAILNATDQDEVRHLLKGRKTVSFYDNMVNNETSYRVTVDLWMYRAAEVKISDKHYRMIEDVVLEMALESELLPMDIQAVIWTVLRQESTGTVEQTMSKAV